LLVISLEVRQKGRSVGDVLLHPVLRHASVYMVFYMREGHLTASLQNQFRHIKHVTVHYMDPSSTVEQSRQSILNSQYLSLVFGPSHAELMKMNTRTNQSVKSALALYDPLPDGTEQGSATWFVRLWESLLPRDQQSFREYVRGPKVLNLSTPLDFCVHVHKDSPAAVIFYIDPLLQDLEREFFRNQSQSSPITQALNVLHDPSDEYREFISRAYDLPQQFMRDGNMHVWLVHVAPCPCRCCGIVLHLRCD
jgi:hypothetical protein